MLDLMYQPLLYIGHPFSFVALKPSATQGCAGVLKLRVIKHSEEMFEKNIKSNNSCLGSKLMH